MLFQYIQVKLIQSSNLFLMLLKIFIILEGRIVCFEFAHGLNWWRILKFVVTAVQLMMTRWNHDLLDLHGAWRLHHPEIPMRLWLKLGRYASTCFFQCF